MRVIGGNFKGKKIEFIKSKTTRPLKDSVRESIFNILKHSNNINLKIESSKILDVYSGVGSFGIECISRSASHVTFIEKNPLALEILEKNLLNLSIKNKTRTIPDKVENAMNELKNMNFNIFFFDPPFLEMNFSNTLKNFKEKNLFDKKHIVIIHREKNSKDSYNSILKVLFSRNYGRSKIIFGKFI